MHLFIIDLFISLDNVAPIIYGLNNKKISTKIYSVNPLQNFSENKLLKFLRFNKFNSYDGFLCLGLKSKIYYFLLKIVLSMPKFILKRLFRLWTFIYRNNVFLSEHLLTKMIKKNNFKTITIEGGLSVNKKRIIGNACKLAKIPLINIPSGLTTSKVESITKVKQEKIIKEFEKIDLYLAPNLFARYTEYVLKSSKFKLLGSARYDFNWLNVLEKIYSNHKTNYKKENKKINIAFFVRTTAYNFKDQLYLMNEIKKISNVEIKTGNKPREIVPLKISLYDQDELNTTQLILWSDIVISSATSILVESVQRNKLTICLEYLFTEKETVQSNFTSHPTVVKIANSSKDTISIINEFALANKINYVPKKDLKFFLKSFINQEDENYSILDNFVKIYSNI